MSSKDRQHRKDKGEPYDHCQSTTDNSSMKKAGADSRKPTARNSNADNPRKRKSRSASGSPDRGKKRKRHAVTVKEEKRKKHRKNKKLKTHRKKTAKRQVEKSKHAAVSKMKKTKDAGTNEPQGHAKPEAKVGKSAHCYDVSDNESELDLSKPMRRISEYIDDKRELCHQTFKTLRGRKLNSMIPEILRDFSLPDLRDMCQSELSGMSKKRVLRILNGDEPEGISSTSSSSSGEEVTSSLGEESNSNSTSVSDSEASQHSSSSSASSSSRSSESKYRARREHHKSRAKVKRTSKKHVREKEKVSTPEAVVDSTCKIEEPNIEETKLSEKDIPSDHSGANKPESEKETLEEDQDVLVVSATDLNLDLDHELAHRDPANDEAKLAPPQTAEQVALQRERAKKKELEIFELEMRARAIRSMILAQEAKDPRLRLKKV